MDVPRLHRHARGRRHRGDAAQGDGGDAGVAAAALADGDVERGGVHVEADGHVARCDAASGRLTGDPASRCLLLSCEWLQ